MVDRIKYIDFFKALAMILVIMGHVNFANQGVKAWIYSFHMPAFFFATGLVLNFTKIGGGNLLVVARKFFKRLMLPFLLWALIFSKFSIPHLLLISYGSYRSISKAGSLTSLWFLPVMYVAVLILCMISRKSDNMNRALIMFSLGIVAFIVGVSLPHLGIGYPFSLDVALVALFFMILGNIIRPYIDQIYNFLMADKKRGVWVCLLLSIVFAGGSLTYMMNAQIAYIHMGLERFGNPVLFAITAICGILMLLFFCIMLEFFDSKITKGLLFVGQNTLCIFAVQKPIIGCFSKLFQICPMDDNFFLFFTTIGTLAVSCVLCIIINKYVPVLIGKSI